MEKHAVSARTAIDLLSIKDDLVDHKEATEFARTFTNDFPDMKKTFQRADGLRNKLDGSDSGKMLGDMLAIGESAVTTDEAFLKKFRTSFGE